MIQAQGSSILEKSVEVNLTWQKRKGYICTFGAGEGFRNQNSCYPRHLYQTSESLCVLLERSWS